MPRRPTEPHLDLRTAFEALNLAYFDGALHGVELGWMRGSKGPRSTVIFGWCYYEENRILINPLLRLPWVPFFYSARWIFHEMLHITHPPVNNVVHHPAFLKAERRYLHLAQANTWEAKNLDRLLGSDSRLTAIRGQGKMAA